MIEKKYSAIDSEYYRQNPNWHKDDSPWKAKQIIKIINNNNISFKTIVDIGCGVGEVMLNLQKYLPSDIKYTGYEISKDAHRISKQIESDSLKFYLGNINDIKQEFDLLMAIDVIEHVENPIDFLLNCKSIAKYKILHIPLDLSVLALLRNSLILDRKLVGHIHFYTKDLILENLSDCGYRIIDYFYTHSASDLPRKTMKSKLAVIPRKIGYKVNKDLTARIMGGFSLLVLAE